jgi:hypothetical protein
MGENYGPKVEYKCFNDCRQEGCPGHVARFGYSRCSDVEYFEIDGKNEYFLDHSMLKAMLESKKQMEDMYRKEKERLGIKD